MPIKVTTNSFIERARMIHNNKYDYSKVEYINCFTPVCIICPIHGEFWQKPSYHLSNNGCPKCGLIHRDSNRKVYGVAVNDVAECVTNTAYHKKWLIMLNRCYHPTQAKHNKSYNDVFVCDEWLKLSNFKEWFENPENGYKEGYQLDKDILVKGNRVYSPETCCFVPSEINNIIKLGNKKGIYPIGVTKVKQGNRPYRANLGRKTIGYYLTPEQAFQAFKYEKEKYIKEIATKFYNDTKITQKVYNALMNFSIDINDKEM